MVVERLNQKDGRALLLSAPSPKLLTILHSGVSVFDLDFDWSNMI